MKEAVIFTIGLGIFGIYLFFLMRMIYLQHKKQAKEQGAKVKDLYPLEDN